MQCCLNGMHISEVPKFLAETPSETTHAIELVDPFDATHLIIILLHLSCVISYFDVFPPSVIEYEDEDIRSHLGTHQQANIQSKKLKCLIIKVRSASLPQQKGDHYLSV